MSDVGVQPFSGTISTLWFLDSATIGENGAVARQPPDACHEAGHGDPGVF